MMDGVKNQKNLATEAQKQACRDAFERAAGVNASEGDILGPAIETLDRVVNVTQLRPTLRERSYFLAGVLARHARSTDARLSVVVETLDLAIADANNVAAGGFTRDERAALAVRGVTVGPIDFSDCTSEDEVNARIAAHRATSAGPAIGPVDFAGCESEDEAEAMIEAHAARHGMTVPELRARLRDSHATLTELRDTD